MIRYEMRSHAAAVIATPQDALRALQAENIRERTECHRKSSVLHNSLNASTEPSSKSRNVFLDSFNSTPLPGSFQSCEFAVTILGRTLVATGCIRRSMACTPHKFSRCCPGRRGQGQPGVTEAMKMQIGPTNTPARTVPRSLEYPGRKR